MGKLVCPLCGAFTSFSPVQIIGRGILLGRSTEDDTEWGGVQISAITPEKYGEDNYAILVCQACGSHFVAEKNKRTDEWLAVYPIQHKTASKEIPEPIKGEFEEASLCFAVEAYRACVAVCEVALEAMWREQGASGLKELTEKGVISPSLYNRANEVRLWANIAKHELIPEVVEKEDAEQLLTYLEVLLNDVYVEAKRLDSLTQKRKQLEKKQQI